MEGMHSPWFSHDVLPVRNGVYQRNYADRDGPPALCFCYWNGKSWFSQSATPHHAILQECPSIVPAPWRGLTLEEFTQRHRDNGRALDRAFWDSKP